MKRSLRTGAFRTRGERGYALGAGLLGRTAPGHVLCLRRQRGRVQTKRARVFASGTGVYVISACISKKSTLRQIRWRCALTQATSLLHSLRPVRPELCCNALNLLTRRRVPLTPCLHLSSSSLHVLLMKAPASHCLFRAP